MDASVTPRERRETRCFLLAWEIGGGLGHVVPLAQVAEPLVERGHEVHFVLRDLSQARQALGALADAPRVRLWQAPAWLAPLQGLPPAASYAELLFHAGYLDAGRLAALVQGWRSLYEAIVPDLLLADHSPTALLAARLPGRGQPRRRALLGSGFFLPPAQQPLPSFRDWEQVDARRLLQSEARALLTCNLVLQSVAGDAAKPLAALHELTAADERFLVTWPELDPYGSGPQGRPGGHYWGALPARDPGQAAVWPEGAGAPVFAYLKGDHPALEPVLKQLAAASCRTLAHVPGLAAPLRQRWQGTRLRFTEGPVSMRSVLAQAQALVCHGGAGTVGAALGAGVPLLMLPMHAEQMLQARRVAATGAGTVLAGGAAAKALRAALERLLADPGPREQARTLAERHAALRGSAVAQRVAERCEALAAAGQG